jgi:CO dehydrogenase maturation factor
MKISVCGKGGSGKSTLVALLASEAICRDYRVLVVDADESNTGLDFMLGFDYSPVPLMELVGGRKGLKERMSGANVISEPHVAISQIPEQYQLRRDNLVMVSIGKILQSLEGCACPMGVLSREFIKKLTLADGELVIVDMEAGVEHFGRGVDTSIDSLLIVVEPALESVRVTHKIHRLASGIGIRNIWAIMNKVPSEEVSDRLKTDLAERNIPVIGCIYYDADIFRSSLDGRIPTKGVAVWETQYILDHVLSEAGLTMVG